MNEAPPCRVMPPRCTIREARIAGLKLAFEMNDRYSPFATAERSVCISGLRLSVKLRESAQSGGRGCCSLFSRALSAPVSI